MATTARQRRTRADWQALISRAERSALSIAAFCAAEGISTASFYLWRKRLRASGPTQREAEDAPPAFVDLGLLAPTPPNAPAWEVELDLGGVILRLGRR